MKQCQSWRSSDVWPSFQNVILISELLDDHRDALKAKEDEVVNLHRGMKELSTTGNATTEEISRLK